MMKTKTQILQQAVGVFDSNDLAMQWLNAPNLHMLEGRSPADLLDTPDGRERVAQMLTAIEYGFSA